MKTMNPGTEPGIKQMIYFSLFFSLDAVSKNLCSPLSIFLLLLLGGKRICRLMRTMKPGTNYTYFPYSLVLILSLTACALLFLFFFFFFSMGKEFVTMNHRQKKGPKSLLPHRTTNILWNHLESITYF